MRKLLTPAVAIMCLALLATPVLSASAIHLVINATEIRPDVPSQLVNGRVLVPIRVISENLGFEVAWYQDIQTVTVDRKGETYPIPLLMPGSIHLVIGGAEAHPDVPPQIVNGRVMVPIRFVSQAFGLEVGWHQDAQMVTVGPLGPVLEVHFIDVGQADCVLVELPNGDNILVDGGNHADADIILDYLAAEKVTSLDYVVVTHPHEDHIGGLDEVIQALPVGMVILPRQTLDTDAYVRLMAAIQTQGLEPEYAVAPWELIKDGALDVDVLGPTEDSYSNVNDCSVVLKVSIGSMDFLLMGDAEASGEADLLATGANVGAEILKVGHHGSSISTTARLLAAAEPEYAVISVGAGNSYGHPAASTLAALAAAGVMVYRTDLNGTIVATATVNSVWFDTEKGSREAGGGGGTSPSTVIVYVTKTGAKYHRAGCQYLSSSRIAMTLGAAKAAGYTPCSACDPPT